MSDSTYDKTNEKISSLIDDEQALDNALIDSLLNDKEIKAKWVSYNLMSDVLNDRDQHKVDKAWFTELSEKLDKEPAILAPHVMRAFKHKVVKQIAGLAVAASVAMVAILSVQQTQVSKTESATQIAQLPSQRALASSEIRPVTLRLNKAAESKLNGYLVNHYEHSITGKMQGLIPYMRMVSVTPAERIVHEK